MSDFLFSTTSGGTTQVYASDGTASGTKTLDLARFDYQNDSPEPPTFTNFDGEALFTGLSSGTNAFDTFDSVYRTDGTAAGTAPQTVSGTGGTLVENGLWVVGDHVLTSGYSAQNITPGLYTSTDGENFTQISSTIQTNSIMVSQGVGFFLAATSNGTISGTPDGLWRTDGTASGTYQIDPSVNGADFTAVANGHTIFVNQTSDGVGTLWVTDGTKAGTHQVVNAALGNYVEAIRSATSVNGKAIFTAVDASGNVSVWSSDGTSAGTNEVMVIGPSDGPTRTPSGYQTFGNKVIFETGYGVAVTDGTKAGTVQLTNGESQFFAVVGNKAIIGQGEGGPNLYVTDGTLAGTHKISTPDIASFGSAYTVSGNQVIFVGFDTSGKTSLYSTSGSTVTEMALPAGVTISANTALDALPVPATTPPGGTGGTTITLGGGAQNYQAASGSMVLAGSGSDTITASQGMVTVVGSSGSLVFVGGTAPSSVIGGAGSETIFGDSGGGTYTAGAGGHSILISQGAAGANTTLTGAAAGDQIFGSAHGNDLLVASKGHESILGGGGNTTIAGGTSSNVIFAGTGPTTVNGGSAGGDIIVGNSGSLTITAQHGDAIFGNTGALNVNGGTQGADSIIGGAGALNVNGRGANMLLVASTSTSHVSTGNGASLIFAGTGSSTITGGTGSMQIVTGSGHAAIYEGAGPTSYDVIKNAAGGTDVLNGFKVATDHIDLFGYINDQTHTSTVGGSSVIDLSDGTKITVVGVSNLGHSILG